jgi:aspartate/methionine/tyrosine aminotransferase
VSLGSLPPFALERYFARWEFAVRHVLCASDVEALGLRELLALCDDDVLQQWEALRLGYTESLGLPALRREIASMYPGLSDEDIVTFSGAEEGIFLAVQAALRSGDHAVVVWPAYQALYEIARGAGAEVTLVPLNPADWSLDVDALIASLRPNTRLVVINFPHNPTGAMISEADLQRLTAATAERDAVLLSDEVYRLLELSAPPLPPAASLADNAVSLGVLSKAYGLAGLRIGWIATRNAALRGRIVQLRDYTTICNAAPSEVLALGALRASSAIIARNRDIVQRNLAVMREFFALHSDTFEWVEPRAGSVCFPRLLHEDADVFADALVRAEGVLVMPGSQFEYSPRYFRVGLGRRDVPQALERMARFIAARTG